MPRFQTLAARIVIMGAAALLFPSISQADRISIQVAATKLYCESDGSSAYRPVKKVGGAFRSYPELIAELKKKLRKKRKQSLVRQLRLFQLEYLIGKSACSDMAVDVVAGYSHTCALLGDRSVMCWGAGQYLGYGTNTTIGDDEKPFKAGKLKLTERVAQLSSNGASHTCALMVSGGVKCWGGSGQNGALGYANTNDIGDNEPLSTLGDVRLLSKAIQVSASYTHTCAVLDSRKVQCWGYGEYGALGYGNKNKIGDDEHPDTAGYVDVGEDVEKVVTGQNLTCVLTMSGKVKCWGAADEGKLGQGSDAQAVLGDDETPAQAPFVDVGGVVKDISASKDHVCAILENDEIKCWGANSLGKLGYGHNQNIGDDEVPGSVPAIAMDTGVALVSASDSSTCALQTNGKIKCWGYRKVSEAVNPAGFQAYGNDEPLSEVPFISLNGKVARLSNGPYHTCVIVESNRRITCWGQNFAGMLGNGNTLVIPDDLTARETRFVKLVK